jgi:hypothetical protein
VRSFDLPSARVGDWSPHVLQDHELIHAYLAALGTPPAFFVEGAASILACRHMFALQNSKPWRDLVTGPLAQNSVASTTRGHGSWGTCSRSGVGARARPKAVGVVAGRAVPKHRRSRWAKPAFAYAI